MAVSNPRDYAEAVSVFLQPLLAGAFVLSKSDGRLELNETVRRVIAPHPDIEARAGMQRYVTHFIWELRRIDPNTLSVNGEQRLKAMRMYDSERENIKAGFQMARESLGIDQTVSFLTHAATVMRYSVQPEERVSMLESGVNDMERSLSKDGTIQLEMQARLRLALGEAYFDSLASDKAETHLRIAIDKMTGARSGDGITVSSSVLALLLLAELRIEQRALDEASKLLRQTLRTLRESDLHKSTFAVCALLSLGSVYSWMNEPCRAMQAVEAGLEVLLGLGFSQMPIHADALRAMGAVHLRAGDAKKAQEVFLSGLRIMDGWMGMNDWTVTPNAHCLHLDVFLVELIAQTYVAQDCAEEASKLVEQAQQKRKMRGLQGTSLCSLAGWGSSVEARPPRFFTRHLY